MDRFRLIQIIHWTAFCLMIGLLNATLSRVLRPRFGAITRAVASLAMSAILFIGIEAFLLELPPRGIVFQWTVGAAGNFYIYVSLLLMSAITLVALAGRHFIDKMRD